jgi:hypothetical protein
MHLWYETVFYVDSACKPFVPPSGPPFLPETHCLLNVFLMLPLLSQASTAKARLSTTLQWRIIKSITTTQPALPLSPAQLACPCMVKAKAIHLQSPPKPLALTPQRLSMRSTTTPGSHSTILWSLGTISLAVALRVAGTVPRVAGAVACCGTRKPSCMLSTTGRKHTPPSLATALSLPRPLSQQQPLSPVRPLSLHTHLMRSTALITHTARSPARRLRLSVA